MKLHEEVAHYKKMIAEHRPIIFRRGFLPMLRTQIVNALMMMLGIKLKYDFINDFTDMMYAGETRSFRTGIHKIVITRSEKNPIFYCVAIGK